jgi:hypothetical protein
MSSADDRLDYANAIRSYSVWVEVWDASMKNRLNCGYVANSNKVKCESLCEQLCKYLPIAEWEKVYACNPGQLSWESRNPSCYAPRSGQFHINDAVVNSWNFFLFHESQPHQQLVIVRAPIENPEEPWSASMDHGAAQGAAKIRLTQSARLELTMANEYLV